MLERACLEEHKHVIEQSIVVDQLESLAVRELIAAVRIVEDFGKGLFTESAKRG